MTNREIGIQAASEFRKEVICRIYKKRANKTFLTRIYSKWTHPRIRDGPIKEIEKFLYQLQARLSSNTASRTEELLKRGYIIEDIEGIKKAIDDEKSSIIRWVEKKCEELRQKIRKEPENEKRRNKRKEELSAT
jgi:hypothetical protein